MLLLLLTISLLCGCCRAFPLPTQYPFHVVDEVDDEQDELTASIPDTPPSSLDHYVKWTNFKDLQPQILRSTSEQLHLGEGLVPLHTSHNNSTEGYTASDSSSGTTHLGESSTGTQVRDFSENSKESIPFGSSRGFDDSALDVKNQDAGRTISDPSNSPQDAQITPVSGPSEKGESKNQSYTEKSSNTIKVAETSGVELRPVSSVPARYIFTPTTMVYISHSDDLPPSPALSDAAVHHKASLHDVVVGACSTVAFLFTLCVLITFTSCCCRRRKASQTDEDTASSDDQEKGQVKKKKKDPLKKAPSSSGLDSPTEGSSSLAKQLDVR